MASNQKQKKPAKVRPAGLPTRQQVMDFIAEADTPAGKREIAKAFGLKGQEKIALKALLKDMADEGLIDIGPARAFHKMGGVPRVTVLKIVEIDDGEPIAVPESWNPDDGSAPPRLRVIEKKKQAALRTGDRIQFTRNNRRAGRSNGHTASVIGIASQGGGITVEREDGIDFVPTPTGLPVPEPSTALLLCLGLMALATGRRNLRRRSS